MPIPSAITDLSTTAASNSPTGTDNVFPDLDNYIRAHASFIASLNVDVTRHESRLSGTTTKSVAGPRSPWYSLISAAPSSFGTHTSVTTAFDGDLSKLMLPLEHRITGAATLSQPTSGYTYTPEAAAMYLYSYNESGYNHSTSTNTGRTGATPIRVKVYQAGGGDHFAFNASCFGNSTRAGSTKFLANPAIGIINGDLTAGVAGLYLNPLEFDISDGGYDCAAIGPVIRMDRTVDTGAKSAVWIGASYQSEGSAYCDAIVRAVGKWKVGLSFAQSGLDLQSNAAIAMKSGQIIALNANANASGSTDADWYATGNFTDYIGHTTSGFTGINFVESGSSRLQVGSTVTVNTSFQIVIGSVGNYANDAAAAAGSVPVGGVYRNGSALQIRVT